MKMLLILILSSSLFVSNIFSQEIKLPKKIYGIWENKNARFEITKDNKIIFITDKTAERQTITEWKIEEYNEELGFISGKLTANKNMGYDVLEQTSEEVGILYFEIVNKKIVIFCTGIKRHVPDSEKHSYHEKTDYRKNVSTEFQRVKE